MGGCRQLQADDVSAVSEVNSKMCSPASKANLLRLQQLALPGRKPGV